MTDALLRAGLRKLASQNPELRSLLVPLLRKEAKEFSSPEALREYLKEHPKADKTKHTVQKSDGGQTPKEDDSGKGGGGALSPEEAKAKLKKMKLPKEVADRLQEYNLEVVGEDFEQAAEIAKKLTDGIASGTDVCKVSPPVCKGNMGLIREKMPQIPGDMSVKEMLNAKNKDGTPDAKTRAKGKAAVEAGADPEDNRSVLQSMLDAFKSEGVAITRKKKPVGQLKATQSQILADKTFQMAEAHLKGKFKNIGDSIVISKDGHILDGHHRWSALLTIDPSRTMNVIEVDLTMKDMLDRADELPGVYREDFEGKPIALPSDIKKKKDAYRKRMQSKKTARGTR